MKPHVAVYDTKPYDRLSLLSAPQAARWDRHECQQRGLRMMTRWLSVGILWVGIGMIVGCAAPLRPPPARSVDIEDPHALPVPEVGMKSASLREVIDAVAAEIGAHAVPVRRMPPITMLGDVVNATSAELDSVTLHRQLRASLGQTGRVLLVNEQRRQALIEDLLSENETLSLDTQIGVGQQLGARLLVTGTLKAIEVDGAGLGLTQYQMVWVITDLVTGESIGTVSQDFRYTSDVPLRDW